MTGVDPISAPLTYPGQAPDGPAVLVLGDTLTELAPATTPVGEWTAAAGGETRSLDSILAGAGAEVMTARTPVLAVGSNASPAQLRRKFKRVGGRAIVPITAVTVHGIAVGVSAHVSAPGYVPATAVPVPAAVSRLFVTWLDTEGLAVMDATEPNYNLVGLDAACTVELSPGHLVPGCLLYVSKHGYLTDRLGEPRKLTDQRTLLTALLADVPGLAAVVGATPEEWVRRAADARVRDRIKEMFRAAGLVRGGDVPIAALGRARLSAHRS